MTQDFKETGSTQNQRLQRAGATTPPSPKPNEVLKPTAMEQPSQPRSMRRANNFVTGWMKKNPGVQDTMAAHYTPPVGEMTIPITTPGARGPRRPSPEIQALRLGPPQVLATYRRLAQDPEFVGKLDPTLAARLQELELELSAEE